MAVAEKKRRQSKGQSKKRCISPRSGSELPVPGPGAWKPGQSGNPAGKSAKQRQQDEWNRRLQGDDGPAMISAVIQQARGDDGPRYVVPAYQTAARAIGLFADAGEVKVVSVTRVVFEGYADGSLPPSPETVRTLEQIHAEVARPEGEMSA